MLRSPVACDMDCEMPELGNSRLSHKRQLIQIDKPKRDHDSHRKTKRFRAHHAVSEYSAFSVVTEAYHVVEIVPSYTIRVMTPCQSPINATILGCPLCLARVNG